jgi:hypothetical protein
MKTSILARAMGVALGCPTTAYAQHNREALSLDRHRLDATSMSTRHDFVFAAPRLNHEPIHTTVFLTFLLKKDPNSADSTIF